MTSKNKKPNEVGIGNQQHNSGNTIVATVFLIILDECAIFSASSKFIDLPSKITFGIVK